MKKPKVFANTINKKINNNQELFESDNINSYEERLPIKKRTNYLYDESKNYDNLTVLEKLDKLFSRNGYIFNIRVTIITKEKKYNTQIAGKVNNTLITLDNDIIKINDIVDIIVNDL